MKLKALLIFNAIVAIVFGVVFVIIPSQVYSLYDPGTDAPTDILNYMGQLFGVALISIGLITWSARNSADSEARQAIIFALFIANCIGFVVTLIGQINCVVNVLGWSTVAIYFLLALGFGYFQFSKKNPSEF
ncbi:MAG: hypothetical protein ABFS12_10780 [Bacteroidota bacterium]